MSCRRALPSVPTRRSSDLDVLERAQDVDSRRVEPGPLARLAQRRSDRPAVFGIHATTGEGDLDRKSTRLNSSHSQISYAVFCLKKKKTSCEPHETGICPQT